MRTKIDSPYTASVTGGGFLFTETGILLPLLQSEDSAFEEERGGEIARRTGFSLTDERPLFKKLGDKYILPYLRK